jgi:hypothetical protein
MLISVSRLRRRLFGAFLSSLFFACLFGIEGSSWWIFLAYYVMLNTIEFIINHMCCPTRRGCPDIYLDVYCCGAERGHE